MATLEAGTAFIQLVPSFKGLQKAAAKAGIEGGNTLAEAFEKAAASANVDVDSMVKGADKAGLEAGAEFQAAFTAQLKAAQAALPDLEIGADSSEAEREIMELKARLATLSDAQIGVDLDATSAWIQFGLIEAELASLAKKSPNIDVKADVMRAVGELEMVGLKAEQLDGKDVDIQVKANTSAASAGLTALGFGANSSTAMIGALVAAIGYLGPAAVAASGVAIGALAGIGSAAAGAASAIGVAAAAVAPVISRLSQYRTAKQQAARPTGGGGGGTTATNLAQQQLREVQNARQIQSAQAAIAKARQNGAKSAKNQAKRVADAEEAVTKASVQSAKRVKAAQNSLANARAQAARAAQQASRQITQAERSLAQAQQAAKKAQEDLSKARRQAVKDLEALNRAVKRGALDQRAAALSVEEAQARLDELGQTGGTELEWKQARLALDQATAALDDQVVANRELADAKAEADAKGVEGSDAVVAARDRVAEAEERVADATQAAADARAAAARTAEENAARIQAAEQAVVDAQLAGIEANEEALERLQEAKESQALAAMEAATAEQEAQKRLAEILQDQALQASAAGAAAAAAGVAGGAAFSGMAEALAGLPASGQTFLLYLDTLYDKLTVIRTAAMDGFLPHLQAGLQSLEPYIPGVANLIGVLAEKLGVLTEAGLKSLGNPFWQSFGAFIQNHLPGAMESAVRSFGNLATGLAGLTMGLQPLGQYFGQGLENMTKRFAEWGTTLDQNQGFKNFVAYVIEAAPKVKDLLGAIGAAFVNLVKGAAPSGGDSLDGLTAFFRKIAEVEPGTINSVGAAITKIASGLALFGGLATVGSILGGIANGFSAVGSVIGTVVGWFSKLGGVLGLGGVAGEAAGAAAGAVGVAGEAAGAAAGAGGIGARLASLGGGLANLGSKAAGLAGPIGIAVSIITGLGTAIVDLWNNNEGFRTTITSAWEGIKDAISRVWNEFLKPVFEAFGSIIQTVADVFQSVLGPVINAVWNGILQPVFELFGTVVSSVFNGIVMPIFKVVATAFQALATALKWVGDNVISPLFKAVGSVIEKVANYTIKPVFNAINTAWKVVSDGISSVWNGFMKPVFDFIGEFLKVTFMAAWNVMASKVKEIWTGIKDTLKSVWDNNIKPIFNPIKTFLEQTFVSFFSTAKTNIEGVWNGLKDIAKKPIEFIVNTVWNNGLAATFNSIAQKLGMSSRLPTYTLNFASGGVLPGYTPGRDVHRFFSPTAGWLNLSGGEGIIRPDALRALGGKAWLDRVNKTRGRGVSPSGDIGLGGYPSWSFAGGGIWSGFTSWVSGAVETVGKAINSVVDFVDQVLEDPVGAITSLVLTPAKNLLSALAGGPLGQIAGGVVPWTFNGITSLFSKGANSVGGPGQRAVTYARKLVAQKVPYVWGGSSIPPGLDCSGLVYYVYNHMQDPKRIARTTAAGYEAQSTRVDWGSKRIGDLLFYGPASNASHIAFYAGNNRLIEEPRPGKWAQEVPVRTGRVGRLKFDEGGYLPRGVTQVLNQTGRPEPVFNPRQWETLRNAATARAEQKPVANVQITNWYPRQEPQAVQRDRDLQAVGIEMGGIA